MNKYKSKGNCKIFNDYENIDCISILSIDRKTQNYIYKTLENIFSSIPENITVNIYVGNENIEYLDVINLEKYLSKEFIPRINVIEFSENYIKELSKFHIHKRAKLNYARVLQDYDGVKGLVIFEDDVDIIQNCLKNINILTKNINESKYIMTLYDRFTKIPTNNYQITTVKNGFSCTQGMYFTHNITEELSKYMFEHEGCYDILINDFRKKNNYSLFYVSPSITQHEGFLTTGLGGRHSSTSFNKNSYVETVKFV
jgi:hypothetical protein